MYHKFSTQKVRGNIILPVVKLLHAKVVVNVDIIDGRNHWVERIRSLSHRSRLVFFPPEKTLRRMACFCCCRASWLRCCNRFPARCKRSCWYVTGKWVCVASFLTCSFLLNADWSSLLPGVLFFFVTLLLQVSGHTIHHRGRPFPPPGYSIFFLVH